MLYHFQQVASTFSGNFSCSGKTRNKAMLRPLRVQERGEEIGDTSTLENN